MWSIAGLAPAAFVYVVMSIKLLKLKPEIEQSVRERRYYSRDAGSKYSHYEEVISWKVSVACDAIEVQTKGVSFHCFPPRSSLQNGALGRNETGLLRRETRVQRSVRRWVGGHIPGFTSLAGFLSARSCGLALFTRRSVVRRTGFGFPIPGQGRKLRLNTSEVSWAVQGKSASEGICDLHTFQLTSPLLQTVGGALCTPSAVCGAQSLGFCHLREAEGAGQFVPHLQSKPLRQRQLTLPLRLSAQRET